MSGSRVRTRSGRASLIGGAAVGLACFVLWTAIARDLASATPAWLLAGLVVSVGVGTWIRLADL